VERVSKGLVVHLFTPRAICWLLLAGLVLPFRLEILPGSADEERCMYNEEEEEEMESSMDGAEVGRERRLVGDDDMVSNCAGVWSVLNWLEFGRRLLGRRTGGSELYEYICMYINICVCIYLYICGECC
jgi:hypothetical protein